MRYVYGAPHVCNPGHSDMSRQTTQNPQVITSFSFFPKLTPPIYSFNAFIKKFLWSAGDSVLAWFSITRGERRVQVSRIP